MLCVLLGFASIPCVDAAGVVVLDGGNRPLGVYTGPLTNEVSGGVRVMTPQGYAFGLRWSGELAFDGFNPENDDTLFTGTQGVAFSPGGLSEILCARHNMTMPRSMYATQEDCTGRWAEDRPA
jgi:hypothetical protein